MAYGKGWYYHFQDGTKLLVNCIPARTTLIDYGEVHAWSDNLFFATGKLHGTGDAPTGIDDYIFDSDFRKIDLDGNIWELVYSNNTIKLKVNGNILDPGSPFNNPSGCYCLFYDLSTGKLLRSGSGGSLFGERGYSPSNYHNSYRIKVGTAPNDYIYSNGQFLADVNVESDPALSAQEFLSGMSTNQLYYSFLNLENKVGNDGFIRGYFSSYQGALYYPNTEDLIDLPLFPRYLEHSGGMTECTEFVYTQSLFLDERDNVNPYDPIPQPDPSPEEPTGQFGFESDPIPVPTLPTISAADTGFTRLFNPSLSQLNQLADYMWTDATFWDTLKNKFIQMIEDPMKYIISLNLVPVAVPNGSPIPVKLLFISTGISMPPVTNQFVSVDCGTYIVKRNYGSALDFSPNTKVSLYLPYIGMVPLDVDEIMPSPPSDSTTLGVKYVVDVFSGTCVAMVTVNGDVRYQFSGHCAIGIPFSAADFSVYQGALIQAAKTLLGAGATAAGMPGVGAALLGAPVQKTSESVETVTRFNPETNRRLSPWEDRKSSVTKAQFGSLMANNITNTVSQVAASKPNVERSAGFSGNTGYLAVRRPYLLFESPRLVNPNEYGKYNGYPCMMYLSFANLHGFTQVQQIQLVGFSGTNPEIDELLALLKSGVIF